MSEHRDDLRAYFFGVARGLVERGIIRRQRGQTWGDLIKQEAPAVGAAVWEDLVDVAQELGLTAFVGIAQVGVGQAHHAIDALHVGIDQAAAQAGRAIMEWFAERRRGSVR